MRHHPKLRTSLGMLLVFGLSPHVAFSSMAAHGSQKPGKRLNPRVVRALTTEGKVQIDYVQDAVRVYELDRAEEKAWVVVANPKGGKREARLVEYLIPTRQLIVTATFPLQDQLREFEKALRVPRGKLKDEDLPRFLGINVKRVAIKGDEKSEIDLVRFNVDRDLIEVAQHKDELLRAVLVDEDALKPFAAHYQPGLMELMPRLVNSSYPPCRLNGFVKAREVPVKDKQDPAGGRPLPKSGTVELRKWDDLRAEKQFAKRVERFRGQYPVFDTRPIAPRREEEPDKRLPDPLIRFFDVDIEPGVQYEYWIQVRLLNPNYGRDDEVARPMDSKIKELGSIWVATPPFTIPAVHEANLIYAVDQWMPEVKNKAPAFPPPKVQVAMTPAHPCGPDTNLLDEKSPRVPVQIHRWFGTVPDPFGGEKYLIADWVIAERVLVRRGEYIGQEVLTVPVPTWNKQKGTFEVLRLLAKERFPPGKTLVAPPRGISVDFSTDAPPLLIDFGGGFNTSLLRIQFQPIREESAMNLLIMNPDGKLIVRNSNQDFADRDNDGLRTRRLQANRERIERFESAGR